MASRYPIHAERERRPEADPVLVVQRKLDVGAADDPYEREADRVADQVLMRLASQTSAPIVDSDDRTSARRTVDAPDQPAARIRRREIGSDSPVGLDGGEVSSDVDSRIRRARSGGAPLEDGVRGRMETAFGADFGGIRIHTGDESTRLNRSLGARAFTVGSDVFFSGNSYDPGSRSGQRLLAHELTHTVQQGAAHADATAQRSPAANISTDTEAPLRRFTIGPQLDLSTISHIRALGDMGQQTYIASDNQGDQIVIKKANIPMNLAKLATIVHETVGPGAIVDSQAIDSTNNGKLKTKIGDAGIASGPSWDVAAQILEPGEIQPNEAPADAARRSHASMIDDGTLLTVQKVVQGGKNAKELSDQDGPGTAEWDSSQLRYLLNDISYMRQIGSMIATDVFMGNEDRVSHTGANLGNWMTAGNKISLIDNMDVNAVANFSSVDGSLNSPFPEILKQFAADPYSYLTTCLREIVREGRWHGDEHILDWFDNEASDSHKKMMVDDMAIGAQAAIDRIDATYGSGKMTGTGRAAKSAIKDLELDGDQVDFWEVLKARAAYLSDPAKGDKLLKTLRKRHAADQKKRKRKSKKKG